VAMATALWLRAPLKMDVIRDRAGLAREVEGGLVENVYRLQVMNTSEQPQVIQLSVSGPLQRMELVAPSPTEIAPTTTRMIAVRVRADPGSAKGSQKIQFELTAPQVHLREPSRFLIP
jgi:polyferredoxin